MADDIACDEFIECIKLSIVPCVEEAMNYRLVLLCCACHANASSLLSLPWPRLVVG
jgi:hypothetical protein